MGLTECASVAFSNPLDAGARRYGSPGVPLGVRGARRRPRRHARGDRRAAGEIELRGANVMLGYYKSPEATAAALAPAAGSRTGDLGYRDADGFYFITGRLKELIIKGGENIAPREIDEALLAHPAVLEAAAVGVPDAAYGQEILACVVRQAGRVMHRGRPARALPARRSAATSRRGTCGFVDRSAEGSVGQGAAPEARRVVTGSFAMPTARR